jgi:PKD repeat protein
MMILLLASNPIKAQVEIIIKPGPSDGKDAYVNSAYYIRSVDTPSFIASAWTYYGGQGVGRSFIHFDLPEIPDSCANFSAVLNLYYDYSSQHEGHGGDNKCKLERVIEDWDETYVDWYNQPSVSPENAVYLAASEYYNQDYPDIDVTSLVLDMFDNPQQSFGFRLSLLDEYIYRSMIFASSDHPDISIRPSLIIRYDTCTLPFSEFEFEVNEMNCVFSYNDTSVTQWRWDFGNGYGSSLQNPNYTYDEPGTYMVCLEVENSCTMKMICDTVVVCNALLPEFSYVVDRLHVNFVNETIGGYNYFWDFGNGFYSYLENPRFDYTESGKYQVCLSIENDCGVSTMCDSILVDANSPVGMFLSNLTKSVKIYPVPAKDQLFIDSDYVFSEIEIFNAQGLLQDKVATSYSLKNYQLSLHGVASGLYLVLLHTEQGVITKKLIIEK